MNSEQTDSKAGGQGGGARAIVRADDYEVRAAAERCFGGHTSALAWSPDGKRLLAIEVSVGAGRSRPMRAEEQEQLAAEGIVPGPEGWCWAAPTDRATRYACRWNERCTFADKHSGPCSCDGEATAWLAPAILAALPPDGTPCGLLGLASRITKPAGARGVGVEETRAALDALVASGEIEAVEGGRWRRWGVPEGWAWRPMATDHEQTEVLYPIESDDDDVHIARATVRGQWWAALGDSWDALAGQGCATPATLAAAKGAAVRRLYERGVFAPFAVPAPAPLRCLAFCPGGLSEGQQCKFDKGHDGTHMAPGGTGWHDGHDGSLTPATEAPKPAPSPQPEDRPARLRAALLAVLTPGPVHTTADLLPALDAAMGEPAGVAVATGAEAMKAAREVGARVDGVEWSLPPIPDGYAWHRGRWARGYLAPIDASDPEREAVAALTVDDGIGGIGGLMWHVKGGTGTDCESVEEGQSAALTAARLAGLFAAPRAEVAPVAAPAPVEPATAPLDALARILTGEAAPTMADATAALAAFRTEILAVALARTIDHAAAKRGDSEGTGKADALATAERERDDARTQMAIEAARADRAEAALVVAKGERDAALHNYSRECALSESLRSQLEAAEEARDEAIATVDRVRERLEPVLAAIAGGRPVVPPVPSQSCSFCGKSSNETRIFVAGIGAAPAVICDECAVFSARIVKEARERELAAIAGGREVGK